MAQPAWGPDALRLHRWLLRHPGLLPRGDRLLLAVSGGQDSMALTALLRDLQPLHGWELQLWHGDHGWHPHAAEQAEALLAWARNQGLPVCSDQARPGEACGEATARHWRYACLARQARARGCSRVLTGHTASDRAETVLLNLARGCHRRGLASLVASRPLTDRTGSGPGPTLELVRPLLSFDRSDTERICRERRLPLWIDPSNDDLRLKRNRLRVQVLPVLEALHPGAARRISQQAGRLAEELEEEEELLRLALAGLERGGTAGTTLDRQGLARLSSANRRRLLQFWLRETARLSPAATVLDSLSHRLGHLGAAGRHDLPGGWSLQWHARQLVLCHPGKPDAGAGSIDRI